MKTKKVECSNIACFRGTVEVRGRLTPEGDPVTEICPICKGDAWIEVPVDNTPAVGDIVE